MRDNAGLISLVGTREEPVNLAYAPGHPQYLYFPESGEEQFRSFLGVPIIHHRQLQGVLVVQRHAKKKFSEDSVTFLVTIAAQLAGAIAHAEASGGISGLTKENKNRKRNAAPLQGQPGSPGVAIGTAVARFQVADLDSIPDRAVEDSKAEVALFKKAVNGVRKDIQSIFLCKIKITLIMGRHRHNSSGAIFHKSKVGCINRHPSVAQGVYTIGACKFAFLFIIFDSPVRPVLH